MVFLFIMHSYINGMITFNLYQYSVELHQYNVDC